METQSPFIQPDEVLELGIFAKTFQRRSIDGVFEAIARHGLSCTQWNWSCVPGLTSLPDRVTAETSRAVQHAAASSGVRIAATSATFNLIDPVARERGFALLPAQAEAAISVGCDLLTLCTGTRNRVDMWAHHPSNDTSEAWVEMLDGLRQACRIATRYGVQLAIEPETANVVSDAFKAERVLRELGSDSHSVSIVLDAANLYKPPVHPRTHPEVIDEALARLGEYIRLAHAKDIRDPAPSSRVDGFVHHYAHTAAGTGILPYGHYLDALLHTPEVLARAQRGQRLPLILHGLTEEQVAGSVAFLRESMETFSIIN
ncbi:MAG: sugar phosphate isomerase/epimerase [Acidobacteriaceae bacterium]|nr:sugar phosphate isomerase/epimerase [Acidobacteriaceae bacterium]MBV9038236.1 sugar phosphate isomerase/epimerase [Acidobacteriaceae bacterium]